MESKVIKVRKNVFVDLHVSVSANLSNNSLEINAVYCFCFSLGGSRGLSAKLGLLLIQFFSFFINTVFQVTETEVQVDRLSKKGQIDGVGSVDQRWRV